MKTGLAQLLAQACFGAMMLGLPNLALAQEAVEDVEIIVTGTVNNRHSRGTHP